MKKLILFIISIAMASIASAVTFSADAAYKTKVFSNSFSLDDRLIYLTRAEITILRETNTQETFVVAQI